MCRVAWKRDRPVIEGLHFQDGHEWQDNYEGQGKKLQIDDFGAREKGSRQRYG